MDSRSYLGKGLIETITEVGMDNYRLVSAGACPCESYAYFDLQEQER